MTLPKPTHYVGRVAGVHVSTTESSGRVEVTLTAEQVRLDSVETAALVGVLREAQRRAAPQRKEP